MMRCFSMGELPFQESEQAPVGKLLHARAGSCGRFGMVHGHGCDTWTVSTGHDAKKCYSVLACV